MFISIAAFIAVFTIVVLVHELGHFLAARRTGVKVYEFSIGFPFSPKIATLFRHRETEFTLRLLPLGGFVSFSRDGDEEAPEFFAIPRRDRAAILSAGPLLNIGFAIILFVLAFFFGKQLPVVDAVVLSVKTVGSVISGTVGFLISMLSGHASWEGLSGPIGIAAIAGKAAAKGFMNLLHFTGMLSVSLGIMNLIPFPALDGGQLLMLLIEVVKRKPFSLKTYQVVNALGMALFLVLTIMVTYKDIVKIIA